MKSIGIIREMDALGRVVIPVELRRTLGLEEGTPVEFCTDRDTIVIKRYNKSCVFCGDSTDLLTFKDKTICPNCVKELVG